MSAGGAFGGARGYQPKPPDKGVFPLDHFGECKQVKEEYMNCLKQHHHEAEHCRTLAKAYLECRMERNLMVKQDLKELGFKTSAAAAASDASPDANGSPEPSKVNTNGEASVNKRLAGAVDRKKQGFIAGIR